ncbi:hypothetical protein QA584_23375 [Anaerocolumna sp. AGMB13025]|uniref:hypothetical protein n=1 Tax=Anaerocolumna sp. AGMB13025 TaxID=3039116 RepID=UPI00241E07CB|nr:hypothetical protein [Anaerocolumna sp. AGMB13025]WFR56525.1 hypothetical protein QA584_23375 [Anaerocolumna sp. AGMB13025]
METYKLGNICICSAKEFRCFDLLREELINNQVLFEMPVHVIKLKALKEWDNTYLYGKSRIHRNPHNGHEIWKDEEGAETIDILGSLIIRSAVFETNIYYCLEGDLYSCLRNKICGMIRQYVLRDSLFGIHSALLGKGLRKLLIIGSKGSGKTSSILNGAAHHGKVFTDEFIFVDQNLKVSCLKRFPAVTKHTLKAYFKDSDFTIRGEIYSDLAGENKYLLDIAISEEDKFPLREIDTIYVLPLNKNQIINEENKTSIVTDNFITGNGKSGEVIQIFETLVRKSKMITIAQLKNSLARME